MPEQLSAFDERKRVDATSETGYVLEQEAPRKNARRNAKKALRHLEEEGKRDNVRAKYARLLWEAATKGVSIRADTGEYVTVEALTDKEAAKGLGVEKTTINARRAELMGDDERYEPCPVAVEHGSRESYVRGTGLENTTYTINPILIDAAE